MTHHDDVEVVAGDSWLINGHLLEPDGAILDLTDATIMWTLLDPNGLPALTGDDATITIVDPKTGDITIEVPKEVTAALGPGRYTDALRVSIIGLASLMWIGYVLVDADPWQAA